MNMEKSMKTNNGFPPVPDNAPAPSDAVWRGIRRGLRRRDFWHVKGKLLLVAAAGASAIIIWMVPPKATPENKTTVSVQTNSAVKQAEITGNGTATAGIPETAAVTATEKTETPAAKAISEENSPAAAAGTTPAPAITDGTAPTLHVTETVSETVLPLPERPIPSAIKAADISEKPANHTQTASETQPEAASFTDTIRVIFPSAFTPNGDGLNDTYSPVFTGEVSDCLLRIYNRKNQLLFQTTRPEEAWDGTCRGAIQPHGAYVCVIKYSVNGKTHSAKSDFLLLRD